MRADKARTHIFLVEDDEKLSGLIREYLERFGFRVTVEQDGAHAVEHILAKMPDLVLLDILLPGKDGNAICRELRPLYRGPIVMLTALDEEVDQIVGLEIGADDYITKPVRPRYLLSRINAILRLAARIGDTSEVRLRIRGSEAPPGKIVIGRITIHLPSRSVRVGNASIELTTTQFDLLLYLAKHAGEIIHREQLFQGLRGIDYDGLNRSIDLTIARIREKIGDDAKHPRIIKSVRGEGYLLVKPS
ncbi:MAG: response regulator [Pseudomonadota bacterium]